MVESYTLASLWGVVFKFRKEVLQVAVMAAAWLIAALRFKNVAQRDQARARDQSVLHDFLDGFLRILLGFVMQNCATDLLLYLCEPDIGKLKVSKGCLDLNF